MRLMCAQFWLCGGERPRYEMCIPSGFEELGDARGVIDIAAESEAGM